MTRNPFKPLQPSAAMLLLAASITVPASLHAAEQPPPELNQGQILVFLGEHLGDTQPGQTLVYGFKSNADGAAIEDEVTMTVTGVTDDARRNLSFEFLSGDRRLNFPDAEGYLGNPVAVQFLERDIRDISRSTETPMGYLRNRIRIAFATPQINKVQTQVGGTDVDATEIIVVPFKTDANLAEFEGYADKEYRFVYADQIPGDLVSVRTRMPAPGGVKEEELRFERSTGGSTTNAD